MIVNYKSAFCPTMQAFEDEDSRQLVTKRKRAGRHSPTQQATAKAPLIIHIPSLLPSCSLPFGIGKNAFSSFVPPFLFFLFSFLFFLIVSPLYLAKGRGRPVYKTGRPLLYREMLDYLCLPFDGQTRRRV